MDDEICKWVIEFMLRNSIDNHFLNGILADFPSPDKDCRLKKAVLLRAIETEISEAHVTERLFIIFEMIEKLDRAEGLAIMGSMRAAYCAVAVECTAKYLALRGFDNRGRFSDAVGRIWRGRVAEMERSGKSELVSRELKGWEHELESALCDESVWKKLETMNTRYEALKLIGDYLVEAWGVLGPSFLRFSNYLTKKKTTNEMHSVSEDVGGTVELPYRTENDSRLDHHGSVPSPSKDETKRNVLDHMNQDLGVNKGSKHTTFVATKPNPERVRELATEMADGQESVGKKVVGLCDPSPSRHVEQAHIAESVAPVLAEKNKIREHSWEDQNDAGPSNPVIIKDAVPLQAVYLDLKNPCHGHQTIVSRPSMMEHNITACTHEWNDSVDDSPEGNHGRLHIHGPKRKAVSPSKYEETKMVRRRRMMWSALEEDTLRTAVQKFGKGNWKLILNIYRDIFDLRTEVDLKDKWRNMTKC